MGHLEAWLREIQRAGVKSIVTLTSDVDWKINLSEKQMDGIQHIWLPAVPLEHMTPQSKQDFLDEMAGSILKQIAEVWQTIK